MTANGLSFYSISEQLAVVYTVLNSSLTLGSSCTVRLSAMRRPSATGVPKSDARLSAEPVYRLAEKEWKDFVDTFTDVLVEADPQIPHLPPKDVIHRIYRDVRVHSLAPAVPSSRAHAHLPRHMSTTLRASRTGHQRDRADEWARC